MHKYHEDDDSNFTSIQRGDFYNMIVAASERMKQRDADREAKEQALLREASNIRTSRQFYTWVRKWERFTNERVSLCGALRDMFNLHPELRVQVVWDEPWIGRYSDDPECPSDDPVCSPSNWRWCSAPCSPRDWHGAVEATKAQDKFDLNDPERVAYWRGLAEEWRHVPGAVNAAAEIYARHVPQNLWPGARKRAAANKADFRMLTLTIEQTAALLDRIAAGPSVGERWSLVARARDRFIGRLLSEVASIGPKSVAATLEKWLTSGVLREVTYTRPNRNPTKGLEVILRPATLQIVTVAEDTFEDVEAADV